MSIEVYSAAEPRELLSQAGAWLDAGSQLALLTLVNIEGNAPYPVGTQMLVNDQGEYSGQITGGCAEVALADQAVALIKSGQNSVERYGLNSKYFDIQLPCGSGIDVHFDVQKTDENFRSIAQKLDSRQTVIDRIEHAEIDFSKTYLPNERILIFGEGPIKSALTELARRSGFDVLEVSYASQKNFESVCDQHTAMVSLFHEHDKEIELFALGLKFDLFYFGALGSRNTHAQRLEKLKAKGLNDASLAKIHGPIGSNIGAVSPSQIAVSILSEIISVMNQDGRFSN
ncbi:MAG: xanthine dehydrogenase accessory factor [Cryomorphaceae bacterium]|jgi:xanthine dehydrogenase accessory factor